MKVPKVRCFRFKEGEDYGDVGTQLGGTGKFSLVVSQKYSSIYLASDF